MKLKEFVNPRVEIVESGDTLRLAAEKMKELDIGSLPVCDNGQLVGMITDRDIAIRAVAKGNDPNTSTVREVMSPDVLWCSEDEDVGEAARIMRENQVRRILVLNGAHELVGITSLGEIATVTGDPNLAGQTLQAVSEEDSGLQRDFDDDADSEEGTLEQTTLVGGIFRDHESAKQAIQELKASGIGDQAILVATNDESVEEDLLNETGTQAIADFEVPSLPELGSGEILVMVEAQQRQEDVLNILNRHGATTAGVRIPEA